MTIEEAIKHCEEVASGETEQGKCPGCAADHKQLAAWLRELSALRAQQTPLNRSRWEGCDHCDEYSQCDLCKHKRESAAQLPCSECLDALSPATQYWEPGVIFCEKCGRPLTEEAWAELERRISGGQTDN